MLTSLRNISVVRLLLIAALIYASVVAAVAIGLLPPQVPALLPLVLLSLLPLRFSRSHD